MTDYYKVLGVDKNASQEEIKVAYRKLSKKLHPDMNAGDVFFENLFKQLQEAYEVLGNVERRRNYDNKQPSKQEQSSKQEQPNKQKHTNYSSSYSNISPIINDFQADTKVFYKGVAITFRWNTLHADLVELMPIGQVPVRGRKTIRINEVNRQFVRIKLKATNTHNSKYTISEVVLENKIYRDRQKRKPEDFWSVKGRIDRSTYSIRILTLSGLMLILSYFPNTKKELILVMGVAMIFYSIACFVQSIKRLHDVNKSGWYFLLFSLPFVNIILVFYLFFAKGTPGGNNYGPSPKDRGEGDYF